MTIPTAIKTVGDALPKLPIQSATTGSLYFHIPFCRKKCPYCHFYVAKYDKEHISLFMEGMQLEILQHRETFENLASIYFGGGTPYLLGPKNVEQILSKTHGAEEISLEANPEDITLQTMREYKAAGINRVSIGVQSLDDSSLITIGRSHRTSQTIRAIEDTYKAGIENITIDLMYDLPSQTVLSFTRTLEAISTLPISHLSLYNMTIEPNTAFFRKADTLKLPSESESSEMLNLAVGSLEQMGFERYEISAFAKAGYESKHNLGYWMGRPFVGLGPSAFSYTKGSRYRNIANWRKWVNLLQKGQSTIDFSESLSYPNDVNELLAVHLRVLSGVDLAKFSQIPEETLANLEALKDEGYLKGTTTVALTEKGALFYDTVASRII